MSKNIIRITEALRRKGYCPQVIKWEPIRRGTEMCGNEGGWYIEVWGDQVDEDGDRNFIEIICAYNTDDALEGIEKLPVLAAAIADYKRAQEGK